MRRQERSAACSVRRRAGLKHSHSSIRWRICWAGAKICRGRTGKRDYCNARAAATDPLGTQRAWSLANGSPGTQQLEQTLGVPGAYVMCFSGYFRADTTGAIT